MNPKTSDLLARLANVPGFPEYLAAERDDAIKYLTGATDAVQIHRAQGKVLFIDEVTKLLRQAKGLA